MNVVWFADATHADVVRVGGKGANLGELTRAGFPVPNGFILPTECYRAVAEPLQDAILLAATHSPERAASEIAEIFEAVSFPPELAMTITTAYAHLIDGRPKAASAVAVRSSAVAEDQAGASFAGLHDTFLNITHADALFTAIKRCWASAWTARAISYRRRLDTPASAVAVAVVVQLLVDARSSGIAFSVDPATARTDRVAIDATWGLGEAIVSGRVTPDHLIVQKGTGRILERITSDKAVRTIRKRSGTIEEPTPDADRHREVLSDADAGWLASLITDVERHYGCPQDVEWARDTERIWLVQARPITALADPVGPVPTEWPTTKKATWYFRASIVEQMPDPLTPLFGDLIGPAVLDTLTAMMERLVGPGVVRPGEAALDRINGYAYLSYSMAGIGRATLRAIPAMAKLSNDPESSSAVLWRRMHGDYLTAVLEAESTEPAQLRATQLLRQTRALLHAGAAYYTSVQTVIPQAATAEIYFTKAYAALGHLHGVRVEDFLLGLDSAPIRADKSLWDLAAWAKRRPELAETLRDGADPFSPDAPDGVHPGDWLGWRRRISEHLARYGHTLYNLDFINPVPADDPAPILEALRFYLGEEARSPYERQADLIVRRATALMALDAVGGGRARALRSLLTKYELYGPMREDALADVGLAWPRMRRNLAELGRRWTESGLLAEATDVFWLTEAEALAAASDWDAGARLQRPNVEVERRKATWRGQKRARPPQLLPRGASTKVWERFMPSVEVQTGDTLKGLGSSGGVATGPARVIRGPQDFASMRPGEVLVAEITTPAYTPLFALASAVVTDVGGVLSHSSIVAREYGIPAVLGTGSATARIETGQRITVDGTAGVVRLGRAEKPDADR